MHYKWCEENSTFLSNRDRETIKSVVEETPALIALIIEAATASETSVKFHQTTRRNSQEIS